MTLQVLLVEDSADERELCRRLFGQAGFDDVREAADGDEALAVVANAAPDLIVLDLAMPARSGVDVLPDLTALAPNARVVVLSNYPRWRMSDIVRRRGAVGYVEKRVPPRRLVREILIAAALTERLMTSVSAQFSGEPSSPRRARQFVRGVLDSADDVLLLDTVDLLVSELVTNAVIHASSAPVVDVHVSPETLRIEVYDSLATLPRPRLADAGGPGGRGLDLIDRSASRWGADRHGDGKVVWFELDRTDSAT